MAEQPEAKRSTGPPTTLNDLPNNLLIHILSFLPILSAVETSFISRKWRNLWHSVPSLSFEVTKFLANPIYTVPEYHQRFAEFITQALLNRPTTLPLHRFFLQFYYSYNHRHRSLVASWFRYALDCGVVDLELNFDVVLNNDNHENGGTVSTNDIYSKPLYDFHFYDLRNGSVECLSLCCCEAIVPSSNFIRFESLRVLELAVVKLDDDSLSDLILRCENLERLVLHHLQGLRKFRISSESLKILELSCYYIENEEDLDSSIEICAPNLSTMKMLHFHVLNYKGDLSSLAVAELKLINTKEYCQYYQDCWNNAISLLIGVERLMIQNKLPMFMNYLIESGERFKLKKLKHLELKTGYTHSDMVGLALLLMLCPLLETLVLDYVYQKDEDASFYDNRKTMQFDFDIPSLQELKMKNFRNTDTEYHILALLGSQNKALKKVVLVPAVVEGTSQSSPVVLDLTPYDDWTSVVASLLRSQLMPRGRG